MTRVTLASLLLLTVSACASRPTPIQAIQIVDSPADIRVCTRLAEFSPPVTTTPGFGRSTQGMLEQTLALGGTHLYLEQQSEDWLLVRGFAYRCGQGGDVVGIRAKG